MLRRLFLYSAFLASARAVIIDRTAIVVGHTPILDSQINREIRVTAFLNGKPAAINSAARKEAASRLIDQQLIRQQIRAGDYPLASRADTDRLLGAVESRYANPAGFTEALRKYGITEADLRERLSWQLTVLRFIDTMFRPQVVVSEADIEHYYNSHRSQFGDKPLAAVKPAIAETITGERVNQLLNNWLDQARKSARIVYLDKSLA
jgi:parvulin-like peptidyl-prolyl isomerase